MKQRTIIVASVLAATGLAGLAYASESREKSAPDKPRATITRASVPAPFSRAERRAIVESAITAVHKSVHLDAREQNGNKIPRRLWGEAIRKLRPLRVINDRMNVMIVLTDDNRSESGIYVGNPLSSHLCPYTETTSAGYERLSKPEDRTFGHLSRYHARKKQSPTGLRRGSDGTNEPSCRTESGTARRITRL